MNIFQEAKSILDKDGKVNALGPMGNQKLTGREISAYFRRNKVRDKDIRKAVEVALDLGGSMTIAYKEIKKFYGNKIAKSKEVSAALKWANEEHHKSKDKPHAHELEEKIKFPNIKSGTGMFSILEFDAKKLSPKVKEQIMKIALAFNKSAKGFHSSVEVNSGRITPAYVKKASKLKQLRFSGKHDDLEKLVLDLKGGVKESLDESKMGDLLIDIQQGANAKELARDFKISPAVAKAFLADYYSSRGKPSKAPGKGKLKEEVNLQEEMIDDFEIRFGKESDWRKAEKLVMAYLKKDVPKHAKSLLTKTSVIGPDPMMVALGDTKKKLNPPVNLNKIYNSIRKLGSARLKYHDTIDKKKEKDAIGESVEEGKFTNIFEAESVIDVAANIVKTKGAAKFKGVLIDLYTASLITNIYGKVNDTNKAKMEKLPLDKLVKVVYKIAGMKEEHQAIIANEWFANSGTKRRVKEGDKRKEKVEGMYRNMVDMWSQEPKVIEASLPIVEAPVLPSTQAGVPSFDYSIQVGVDKYVAEINKQLHSGRFAKLHKEKKTEMKARKATKYYRVEEWEMGRAGSIHAFIDIATGDIFKPAGWKAPAKGARGNIRDQAYINYVSKYPDAYYGGHLYK